MRFKVGDDVMALEGPAGQKTWQRARVTSAWESGTPGTGYGCFYSVALDAGGSIVAIPESELDNRTGRFTVEHARRLGALERDPGESVLGYFIRSASGD
jgi:hypothetical protein